MNTLLPQRISHRSLTPSLLALVIALTVQSNGFAADATVDPVHATHVANGTMPPDKPKDEPAMTLVVAQLREKVAQLEAQLAKMPPNQPSTGGSAAGQGAMPGMAAPQAGMAPGAAAAMKPSSGMDAMAAPPGGSPSMMAKMDKMMGMMDKMMGMGAPAMPAGGAMAGGDGKSMPMDPGEMAGMGGTAMPAPTAPPMKMPSRGMNMEKMKMAQMMGMGAMSPAAAGAMPQSALPGFPGASHLYHIGATDFFLDHQEHISLTTEQQAALRQAKEKALLAKSSADRAKEQAEQELWALTAVDQPNAKAIGTKIADIGKITADERYAFILSVGEASKILTDQQRQSLTGFAPADPTPAAMAPSAAMAPMGDM